MNFSRLSSKRKTFILHHIHNDLFTGHKIDLDYLIHESRDYERRQVSFPNLAISKKSIKEILKDINKYQDLSISEYEPRFITSIKKDLKDGYYVYSFVTHLCGKKYSGWGIANNDDEMITFYKYNKRLKVK